MATDQKGNQVLILYRNHLGVQNDGRGRKFKPGGLDSVPDCCLKLQVWIFNPEFWVWFWSFDSGCLSLSTLFCHCVVETHRWGWSLAGGYIPRVRRHGDPSHPLFGKTRKFSTPSVLSCSVLFCKTGGTTMTTRMTTTMTMMTTTMTNNKWDEDDNPPKPIPKMPRQFFSNTFSATIGALTSGTKSKATTNLRMNENLLKSPFQEHFVHSIFWLPPEQLTGRGSSSILAIVWSDLARTVMDSNG